MTETVALDPFDHRLLDLVRQDNLLPARALAERVGLSESAVLRRLRRLRSTGVIVADVAVIDPARLTPSITIHVLVQLHQSNLRTETAFAQRMQARAEVVGAWNVTGRTDFLLIVAVPTIAAYQHFADTMLAADDAVLQFETLVTLREIVRYDPTRGRPLL